MDLEFWMEELREAQAELDGARGKSAVDIAARKVMRARAELKALAKPTQKPTRGRAADASS